MAESDKDEQGTHIFIPDKLSRAVTVTIVTGLLGGTGISAWGLLSPAGRADPFTGTEGSALEARVQLLEHRMDAMELQDRQTEWEIDNHRHKQ